MPRCALRGRIEYAAPRATVSRLLSHVQDERTRPLHTYLLFPPVRALLLIVLLSVAWGLVPAVGQPNSYPNADDIALEWEVLTNSIAGGSRVRSALRLENRGRLPLREEGWTLYFNFSRTIDPKCVTGGVDISRINGDFYALTPAEGFESVEPGETRTITFEAVGSAIKAIDAPSGPYVVFDDETGSPQNPTRIGEMSVAPFDRLEQTRLGPNDNRPVPTPASRYEANQTVQDEPSFSTPLVPTPSQRTSRSGHLTLEAPVTIAHGPTLDREARLLADWLAPYFDHRPSIAPLHRVEAPSIRLRQDTAVARSADGHSDDAYRLEVHPDSGVEIVGRTSAGVFYGIQSLRARLPPDPSVPGPLSIASQTIVDAPRFAYRGLHLDVARNFQSVRTVKRLLDAMAAYKLNRFHLHLTDDEGWRLAIDGLPELTKVGGRRGHTLDEHDHLVPSRGSGPHPDPDSSMGSGWYTRNDFIEILRYADARHIQVIPEIDMPGHARAAVQAMEARTRRLKAEGRDDAGRYRLVHPEDSSDYRSGQGWTENAVDVCRASTYRFLETVIEDVIAMYRAADAPLQTAHMGGDEVADGVWTGSPACADAIASSNRLDEIEDLPAYFAERMDTLLDERGLELAGWEEMALTDAGRPEATLEGDIQTYVWSNVWGAGGEDLAYRLAHSGYDVVMSHASNFYFDMAYSKHPQEAGFRWAGFIDTRDPFIFQPFNLYQSAEVTPQGKRIDPDSAFADRLSLRTDARDRILGLQGQLWGETLRSARRVDYMAAPRFLGLAERAWAPRPDWARVDDAVTRKGDRAADWNRFAHRLGRHELPRLAQQFDLAFRVPPPGAIIHEDTLRANTPYPGLVIRYTTDGSTPTSTSPLYTEPVSLKKTDNPVVVRTFDATGRGSRPAILER